MDDQSPATKADVNLVRSDVNVLKSDVSVLKTDVNFMKSDMKLLRADLKNFEQSTNSALQLMRGEMRSLRHDNDRILDVLINIDRKLTGKVEDHEERITKLETTIAA